jgi:hypothetical protein
VGYEAFADVPENDSTKFGPLGASEARGLDEFAGSHGKEICANDEVDGMFVYVGAGF